MNSERFYSIITCVFCSPSWTHQSFLNTCQEGEIARCLIFTTLWFSWNNKWQKKMLQPENMSLLKNMLPLSTAAHITKCARSPPINSPCWDLSGLEQMRYRNTETGKLKLCSWWNHEWQVSTQSVQHNIWKWVNHGHIFHIVNVATCSCFLLQLLFLDTPLPGLFCPEKASKK